MHKTLRLLVLLLLCGFNARTQEVPANQLLLPDATHTIPFIWHDQYAALLIPVTLPGCTRTFFMQFDTGSPYSLFYRNKLKAIGKHYPASVQVTDTTENLTQFRFTAGEMSVLAKTIVVRQFDSTAIDPRPGAIDIIGTLGTDFIDNRLVYIHYPRQSISLVSDRFAPDTSLRWSGFIYQQRRILFPVNLQGTSAIVYFDTGSSAFALITDKTTAMALASPGAIATGTHAASWGKTLKAFTLQTNDSIVLAGTRVPIGRVTYFEGVSEAQINAMKRIGIGGMIGNALLLHATLVIDTRHKKYSVF